VEWGTAHANNRQNGKRLTAVEHNGGVAGDPGVYKGWQARQTGGPSRGGAHGARGAQTAGGGQRGVYQREGGNVPPTRARGGKDRDGK